MTRARDLADLIDAAGAVKAARLSNVQTPTLSSLGIDTRVLPTGWSAALSGTDMVLSYSGTAKVKIASDGSVLAVDDVTAFGSI